MSLVEDTKGTLGSALNAARELRDSDECPPARKREAAIVVTKVEEALLWLAVIERGSLT